MSLSSALSIAQSALLATSRQTSVVTRNVADADNPNYSRRIALVTSTTPGARSVDIQRATNDLLFRQNLGALSAYAGQNALYSGMDQLDVSVNGVDNASSPSTAIGNLQQALQLYATSPSNQNLGSSVIDAAKQVVRSLNRRLQGHPGFPHPDRRPDRYGGQRPQLAAQPVPGRQHGGHFRNPFRHRCFRCARPARRSAEEDRQLYSGLDLHAWRQ